MTLRVGEPYGDSARLESLRRLTNQGTFRSVSIDLEQGLGDNVAHVIVTVEELPPTSTSFGGGLEVARRLKTDPAGGAAVDHTDVAPRGFFEIGRRNLGGKNRSVDFFSRVSLRPGATVGQGYGFSEYRVAGTYFEPRAFQSETNLTMGISSEQVVTQAFDYARQSLNADALRRLTPRVNVSGRYALEFTRIFNNRIKPADQPIIDRILPQVRLSILSSGAVWDRRNDPIDPIRGTVVSADSEFAARRIGSEVGYAKVFAQASGFHLVTESKRVVLAGRAEVGIARGFERDVVGADGQTSVVADLPASQRFFAGGSTTVRGFQLDRLGASDVLTEDGVSKGGNAIVVLNAELRTTLGKLLKRDFGVVGFMDAGNVFARAHQLDFTQLRSAYGFGFRYNSPLGPVRLDFGFKVHPQLISGRREHGWEYHLNIGEAF
jgi:outer membrane protein assembly factor BamA